jgi:hypothetical protein
MHKLRAIILYFFGVQSTSFNSIYVIIQIRLLMLLISAVNLVYWCFWNAGGKIGLDILQALNLGSLKCAVCQATQVRLYCAAIAFHEEGTERGSARHIITSKSSSLYFGFTIEHVQTRSLNFATF